MSIRERIQLLRRMWHVCVWQNERIEEWKRLNLQHARSGYDMAVAWRVSMEAPEVDLRDEVDSLVTEWGDQVARLEEQVV
jgi:monomeric isocitrate dehydrogenase